MFGLAVFERGEGGGRVAGLSSLGLSGLRWVEELGEELGEEEAEDGWGMRRG